MELTYDSKHNIAYISLQKRRNVRVETLPISDSLNIDLVPDGTVFGIELLNANQQLKSKGKGKQVFTNLVTGKSFKFDFK